jgi:diguanylate cyclase (GGDEF)-like protein
MRVGVVLLGALVAVGLWALQTALGAYAWVIAGCLFAGCGLALSTALERAMRDPLTGLANRRYALRRMERQIGPVLLIDLDHFKQINDRYGHAAGDRILKRVARAISRSVRQTDVVARWGGEEFVVFMPAASPAIARMVATRIASAIRAIEVAPGWELTASFGLAFPGQGLGAVPHETLERADRALYDAKRQRDCLVVG